MIRGYLHLNIVYLYPDESDAKLLEKQGFKQYQDSYYLCLIKTDNSVKNSDPLTIEKYFLDKYNKAINNNKEEDFCYIGKDSSITYGKVKDKDSLRRATENYSINYDVIKRQYRLSSVVSSYISDKLIIENTSKRYSIDITDNNKVLEYELIGEDHDYYSETVISYATSSVMDNFLILTTKNIIDLENHKNQEVKLVNDFIKKLIDKLGTNPAVQGAPILLPTDITELTQDYNNIINTINTNYDIIKDNMVMQQEIIGINNSAKQ